MSDYQWGESTGDVGGSGNQAWMDIYLDSLGLGGYGGAATNSLMTFAFNQLGGPVVPNRPIVPGSKSEKIAAWDRDPLTQTGQRALWDNPYVNNEEKARRWAAYYGATGERELYENPFITVDQRRALKSEYHRQVVARELQQPGVFYANNGRSLFKRGEAGELMAYTNSGWTPTSTATGGTPLVASSDNTIYARTKDFGDVPLFFGKAGGRMPAEFTNKGSGYKGIIDPTTNVISVYEYKNGIFDGDNGSWRLITQDLRDWKGVPAERFFRGAFYAINPMWPGLADQVTRYAATNPGKVTQQTLVEFLSAAEKNPTLTPEQFFTPQQPSQDDRVITDPGDGTGVPKDEWRSWTDEERRRYLETGSKELQDETGGGTGTPEAELSLDDVETKEQLQKWVEQEKKKGETTESLWKKFLGMFTTGQLRPGIRLGDGAIVILGGDTNGGEGGGGTTTPATTGAVTTGAVTTGPVVTSPATTGPAITISVTTGPPPVIGTVPRPPVGPTDRWLHPWNWPGYPTTTTPVTTTPPVTYPATTTPITTGPPVTYPATTAPITTGPPVTYPATTTPITTGPPVTYPATTTPATTAATTAPATTAATTAATTSPGTPDLSGLTGGQAGENQWGHPGAGNTQPIDMGINVKPSAVSLLDFDWDGTEKSGLSSLLGEAFSWRGALSK